MISDVIFTRMKQLYLIIFLLATTLGGIHLTGQAALGSLSKTNSSTIDTKTIKVYPNPATSMITLSAPADKVSYITINNIIGKRIRRVEASADGRYDVSDLRKGVYIIRIFDRGDELVKALRLSKV